MEANRGSDKGRALTPPPGRATDGRSFRRNSMTTRIRPRAKPAPTLLAEAPGHVRPRRARIVPRPGDEGLQRIGFRTHWVRDLYHETLIMPWWKFLAAAAGLYLAANVLFAALYLADPGGIAKARPGSLFDAFFFSIQTMATIGYGVLVPDDLYTNLVVTAETIVALLVLALVTGLLFSRFSRPTARVLFSSKAVVCLHDGVPTLQVRLSNGRRNQILEAAVKLSLLRNERTAEGAFMRRFYDLRLARERTPVFSLTFTLMHPIGPESPLRGATEADLAEQDAELLVTVTGIDETMSQTIHARWSYTPDEILMGARFADMFGYTPEGLLAIDYRNFDVTVPDWAAPDAAEADPADVAPAAASSRQVA